MQRVPATESQGRIHTSTVTVAVMPEAEEVDIQIEHEDLRIDVLRAGGPGGQSVNTTDSAVRITHLPTGLVVQCQDEKSQHKNKAKALKILRARLLDLEQQRAEAERARERRAQVGTGERSEKIRTYNFPQSRVTDHRAGVTLHKLDAVLAGDLDELLDAVHCADRGRPGGWQAISRARTTTSDTAHGSTRRRGERRGERPRPQLDRARAAALDDGPLPAAGDRDAAPRRRVPARARARAERLRLYVDFDKPVVPDERARFRELVRQRATLRVPVSILLGEREFWSLSFKVTKDVLTPRPDTETLVEAALSKRKGPGPEG